jgi:hypothetical protein
VPRTTVRERADVLDIERRNAVGGAPKRQVVRGSEPLLALFHQACSGSRSFGDLSGTVCVGVRAHDSDHWWSCSFGATTRSRFVDAPLPGANAVWLLDAAAAHALLARKIDPIHQCWVEGDRDLLRRFLERLSER